MENLSSILSDLDVFDGLDSEEIIIR